jgi:hypothetical protein
MESKAQKPVSKISNEGWMKYYTTVGSGRLSGGANIKEANEDELERHGTLGRIALEYQKNVPQEAKSLKSPSLNSYNLLKTDWLFNCCWASPAQ